MNNGNGYRPNISGFSDFCSYLMDGRSFLWCGGHLKADFDCLARIDCAYNFTDQTAIRETEKAIIDNWYMFDTEESTQFYYPNDNMLSGNNSQMDIIGYVATLKEQYVTKSKYIGNVKATFLDGYKDIITR